MPWWLATVSREDQTTARVAEAGFQPALFLYERSGHVRGKFVRSLLQPIYPNYLFVRSDGSTERLLDVEGVYGLVRCEDGDVAEVADAVVDDKVAASRRLWRGLYVLPTSVVAAPVALSKFAVGDTVEVIARNAWWLHQGTVESIVDDGHLVLEMTLFGRSVSVRMSALDVDVVDRREIKRRSRPRSKHRSSSVDLGTPQFA